MLADTTHRLWLHSMSVLLYTDITYSTCDQIMCIHFDSHSAYAMHIIKARLGKNGIRITDQNQFACRQCRQGNPSFDGVTRNMWCVHRSFSFFFCLVVHATRWICRCCCVHRTPAQYAQIIGDHDINMWFSLFSNEFCTFCLCVIGDHASISNQQSITMFVPHVND